MAVLTHLDTTARSAGLKQASATLSGIKEEAKGAGGSRSDMAETAPTQNALTDRTAGVQCCRDTATKEETRPTSADQAPLAGHLNPAQGAATHQ